ncbi:CD2-associated protein [Betta splendens]|uniref:Osteoclast-stimulating factor 1 n=1 Tax=Betta splendens TaxID=158456 RepID=A0A6P7LRQ9_BETSP|nr:CD2-associated protein [Betta splendens]
MEVVVEYEYDALHDDELTLRPGDIIKNVRHIEEDGWMEGDLNGKRGLFPDNFVKEVKKESKEAKETKNEEKKEETSQPQKREKTASNVANLVQRMSTIGIPTGGFQPQPPATPKKPKKRQCKVLFDYHPQNEDELELKAGDIVDITEEVEEGWWSGTVNGKSGLFPSNFVKEVESTGEDGDSTQPHNHTTEETSNGSAGASTTTPTTPQSTTENGVAAQPKKVRGVGFGDIFKEGSVKLRGRRSSTDTEEKKEKPAPSLPSAAKPTPHMTDLQKVDGDNKSKAKEYCKVTFAFDASNEDELSLKEGDIIHILSKDTGEPGWWRGETNGKEGVFPDNFVVMVSEAEKETLVSRGSLKSSPKQDAEETLVQRGSLKSSPKPNAEERPIKPPPPNKGIANKPELPSADKKPHHIKPENRVDKSTPDQKQIKAAPPQVPPKKAVLPPGKGKPGNIPPKPATPTPNLKHNGEMRPKSELEPSMPSKLKTLSGDWGEKPSDTVDLMSFDDLSSSLEKLNHPTVNRPKMPGRRLPAHFTAGYSPNKEQSIEKSLKTDEEDAKDVKPKLADTRKSFSQPSTNTSSQSPPLQKPVTASAECRPTPSAALSIDGLSQSNKAQLETEEPSSQLDELRNQMKELLLSVDMLKSQQMKEITELREALDEEKQKRMTLQMEIEKLKRTVNLT